MARLPRVVVVDVAHHVTQRGNARQVVLANDPDRVAYLELLLQYSELYQLSRLGYCLMSNHVHLIVVPRTAAALSQTLKHAHGRYASYWNARGSSGGHVWQGPANHTGQLDGATGRDAGSVTREVAESWLHSVPAPARATVAYRGLNSLSFDQPRTT